MTRPVRIANCSGFYGDRLTAAREMVEGGPIDVLSGDWLAELTMAILLRERLKRPDGGFARTFLTQIEPVLGTCLDRGIRIVTNAGGLNPGALAQAISALGERLGRTVRVAVVSGDDVLDRLGGWDAAGALRHLETGAPLTPSDGMPLAAHAYLGAWGVAEALGRGADVVVTGRVTDAALVVGPAAWWHGWSRTDWDALAGALVAGHVIECGTQATGGNFSFFREVPGLAEGRPLGFPIAEIAADGSAVITKHPGTSGLVSRETVLAQLLYEIGGPVYASPDVLARFDTVQVEDEAPDRVRVHGTRGLPPTDRLKAGVLVAAGFRNQITFLLGGDEVEAKADALDAAFWSAVGGKARFADARTDVVRGDGAQAHAGLRLSRVTVSASDPDGEKLGRAFGARAVELALGSVPGLTLDDLPGEPRPIVAFWPTLVPRADVPETVTLGEDSWVVAPPPTAPWPHLPAPAAPGFHGSTTRGPLGRRVGARSGDKAGNANVGLWVRDPADAAWLFATVTEDAVRGWLGGFEGPVRVHRLPNLGAVNVELVGWLGRGVAANLAPDPQAKGLAEALRTVEVALPASG